MKRVVTLTIFLLSLLYSKDSFNIGVLYWSMNIGGQVAMRDGLETELEKINKQALKTGKPAINYTYYVAGDGEEGIERQITQFYELISKKPDIIIVQPTDNAALVKPLLEANKKKIPVIAYDQYISAGKLLSFITTDNYQAGYLNGEFMANYFDKKTAIDIILVEYPHVSSTVDRVEGFLDALRDLGKDYKIVKTYEAVEPKSGKEAGEAIVSDIKNGLKVDMIFTVNDGGGYYVVEELNRAGIKDIAVATIDGDEKSVEIIKNGGIIKIDSAQFCGQMGALALKEAYNYLLGNKVSKSILIPPFPVTKDSLLFYNGWSGEPPNSYTKKWFSHTPVWTYELKRRD